MEAYPVDGQIFQAVVEGVDAQLLILPVLRHAHLRIHLPSVGEIRIVDLEDKTGVDDGLVFLVHGGGDGEEVSFVSGVVFVLHPVLHGAGSDGGEKGFFDRLSLERGFQILDVRLYLWVTDILERLSAVEDPGVMTDGGTSTPVKVLGELDHVAAEDGGRPEIWTCRLLDKAAEPLARIA